METRRPTAKELMVKMIPPELNEDENLIEAFEEGFKKAWKYKEIERRCEKASRVAWRGKYERFLKFDLTRWMVRDLTNAGWSMETIEQLKEKR